MSQIVSLIGYGRCWFSGCRETCGRPSGLLLAVALLVHQGYTGTACVDSSIHSIAALQQQSLACHVHSNLHETLPPQHAILRLT